MSNLTIEVWKAEFHDFRERIGLIDDGIKVPDYLDDFWQIPLF